MSTIRTDENEKALFDAIQHLKDCVFGATQHYTPFCYSYSQENGYVLKMEKVDAFVRELSEIAKTMQNYNEKYIELTPAFFKTTILLLAVACNPDDWRFCSIRMLCDVAVATEGNVDSPFDIIVQDAAEAINKQFEGDVFWNSYNTVVSCRKEVEWQEFYLCTKLTLERFVDNHELNMLNDSDETHAMVSQIRRTAFLLERKIRQGRGVRNGVYDGKT